MTLNATQKNLLFAAGTAAVAAAGPVAPLSALALLAQPAVAATSFTKGRNLHARIGQAGFGAAAGFVGLCTGILMNPTIEKNTQVAKAPAPVEQVVEVAEEPKLRKPVQVIDANDTPWAAPPVDPATVADAAPGNVDPDKPRVAPTTTTPAPVTRSYEYPTVQAAESEMCAAGRQYFGDVIARRMTIEQGKNEVRQYSTYLSRNSPAGKSQLLTIGMACSLLWK